MTKSRQSVNLCNKIFIANQRHIYFWIFDHSLPCYDYTEEEIYFGGCSRSARVIHDIQIICENIFHLEINNYRKNFQFHRKITEWYLIKENPQMEYDLDRILDSKFELIFESLNENFIKR